MDSSVTYQIRGAIGRYSPRKETSEMTKKKVGLVLFCIGIIWTITWESVAVVKILPLMHSLALDEFNQTIWAFTGSLMVLRGVSMPLGAIVAGIGILLYSSAKGSTVWKFGIGLFTVLIISLVAMGLNFYSAPLFGIGGTLILLSFIGILWLWAKERMALDGSSTTALDFKLVGYVFMLMAAFYI
jgi:hypothetical protein